MSYAALKHLHIACVVLSGLGFCLRGWSMLNASPLMGSRAARVIPHLVDTVLLGSALTMAWLSSQYPFAQNWLTAKFFGLLAYIVCGSLALKRGRTLAIRKVFLALALGSYTYIVTVALTRSPLPYLW